MSSNSPLLTLAVPTYNRLECLRLLLGTVEPEIVSLRAAGVGIELLISNNASTDGTSEYLDKLKEGGRVRVLRNSTNIGSDANVTQCFSEAHGRHVWIMGDDDLPLPGVIKRVVTFLRSHRCDLLYLPARWYDQDLSGVPRSAPPPQGPRQVDAMWLALRANAYLTFLSSWIVDKTRYLQEPAADFRRFEGTSLSQLEWHLALLAGGGPMYAAPADWVLARGGHSGGYSLFETFVERYHRILGDRLASAPRIRDFLQEHVIRGQLPGLVWAVRIGEAGQFQVGDWTQVESMLTRTWPELAHRRRRISRIAHWPRPLAHLLMAACWFDTRAWLLGRTLMERVRPSEVGR